MIIDWIKWIYFYVNEFEVGVNCSIFSGDEQQKVYLQHYRVVTIVYST